MTKKPEATFKKSLTMCEKKCIQSLSLQQGSAFNTAGRGGAAKRYKEIKKAALFLFVQKHFYWTTSGNMYIS